MIVLNVEKYCDNCPDFEVVVNKLNNLDGTVLTKITCEHSPRCTRMMRYLKERKEKDND